MTAPFDFLKKTALFLLALVAGWHCSSVTANGKPLQVFVSIPPQAFLAERLGNSDTTVSVLAEKGQDAHTFSPSPKQAISLGKADIYFTIGIPFEKQLVGKIGGSNKTIAIIDSVAGITKRKMDEAHDREHHEAGEPDPHVWLSPPLLKIIARNMVEGFVAADPPGEEKYRRNYLRLIEEIERLHVRVSEQLAPFKGETVFVYHPAFGYLTDTYGLIQKSIEISGKSPSARELQEVIKQARAENTRIIFVQPQFDRKTALAVAAAINGAVVPLDDLSRDLLQSIADMATKIEASRRR